MVINSEKPHLVGVDPDILSTGLVFYYLKVALPPLSPPSLTAALPLTDCCPPPTGGEHQCWSTGCISTSRHR